MKTWALQNATVIAASITDADISTADCDEQGYLVQNGTNRSLYWALEANHGVWLLVMRTNGYDEALPDDMAEAATWLEGMGDLPGKRVDRLRVGVARVFAACDFADNLWPDMADQIDWARDKAQTVLDEIADYATDEQDGV